MTDLLDSAEAYLREEVAPVANLIDRDVQALRGALDGLCDRGLMALRRPAQYGGPATDEATFRRFQEAVARYSGSLAFLQTQHQSAVSLLAKGENEDLKQEYLPYMANGEKLMGIGFSQLRRPGPPLLRADPENGGYELSGHAPWVTGWGFFKEFLVGASLPDGQAAFGVVPFVPVNGIKFGEVMRLAAMESPQTVTADFDRFFLAMDKVAFLKPPGWIHENDLINITVQGFFAVGCARAGLDVVWRAHEKKGHPAVKESHDKLSRELEACRTRMVAAQDASSEDVTTQDKLGMRAWAIDLAVRCALAGVASTGGSANSVDNSAQRVYREALVYAVSAQTSDIMAATLERLTARQW